jgi:hypothetical protein
VRRHVSAEVLALHREGAVSPRKAGRITAHLAICKICSGLDADLGAVQSLLAATQLPPMPEVYAERIQLAISNEATVRVVSSQALAAKPEAAEATVTSAGSAVDPAAGGESAHTPGRLDLPERRHRKSRRFPMPNFSSPLVLRGLAAAGAVVIVAGAGVLFIRGHGTTGSNSGSGGAAVSAPRRTVQHAVPGPANASGTNAGYSAKNGPVAMNYRLNGKLATARALTSGHDYTRQNMVSLVHKDLASAPGFGKNTSAGTYQRTAPPRALFGGIRVFKLIGCLTRLATGGTILVADVARYLGRPATIVVLRSSGSTHQLNVVVVRFSCSLASPDIITQVTIPPG